MSVTTASGVSATLVQPAVFRGAVAPSVASLGDLWEDTSGSVPVLKHCTAEPNTWTAISSAGGAYNPASVAITGGTIDGVPLGTTTPAAGTFTTLTAQTEVLSGGNNNFSYSNTFTNAYWLKDGSLSITAGQTDPFGGTNATLLSFNAQFQGLRSSSVVTTAGGVYTASIWCYVASGTRTFSVVDNGGTIYGTFTANTTWTRYSVTFTSTASTLLLCIQDRNSSGFVNAYIYGAQVEQGSTVSSYVPTTTAAVNTSNILNISGSQIFTASNGSLSLQPAGTGAIQAQATTSSATGGNARGANAVDWQTSRSAAARVASGANAVISGGGSNTSSGYHSTVAGGLGGTASSSYAFVGSGLESTAAFSYASVVGGFKNAANGAYNFIGGGYANTGTSGSAVTTQSATMNGTTAVTLSGSNANIKVGQLISGTYMSGYPNETYVAAVSGTSLTLSQAASGSGTATLSFYTPHGVVVGGGNNQATGSYSFIGGGGDAGTAGNRNVASGAWSTVVGGFKNTASNLWSFAGGGGGNTSSGEASVVVGGGSYGGGLASNTASGTSSFVGSGYGNNAAGYCSFIGGGSNNLTNGNFGTIVGGVGGTTRAIGGYHVFPANQNPFSITGSSQTGLLVLAKQTTDATPTVLVSDTSAAGTNNQVILPNNSAYYFRGTVVAGVTGGGNTKGWTVEGVIKRGANAASTTVVGVTVASMYADAGAVTWTIGATADTTNGGLAITFTGQAATTIRCVAKIETTEMTY